MGCSSRLKCNNKYCSEGPSSLERCRGCEWLSPITFYLVCQGQQEIPHSLTQVGPKGHPKWRTVLKSEIYPAHGPDLSRVFKGPRHRASLKPRRQSAAQAGWSSKGRRYMEAAAPTGAHPSWRWGLWKRKWDRRQDRGRQKVGDEVCSDIALDVVNISLCFVPDRSLGGHDQSA